MNFKSLLLGSAAAMLAAGGAQAADLTVAEPVDYVKVCDAFGAGYFYSPGTDTCIKIGGYVKFGTSFGQTWINDVTGSGSFNPGFHDSAWGGFYTETSIQMTASTVTEFGNLTGWIDYRAKTGNAPDSSINDIVNSATNGAYVDSAYLELGPLKAGFFTSLFDFGRGYTDTGAFGSDSTTDHIQLTYAANGFGFAVSVEDSRDRNAAFYQSGAPDVIGAITYASGIFTGKLAAAWVNDAFDPGSFVPLDDTFDDGKSGWAIGAGLEIALDNLAAGDRFFVSGAYGKDASSFTGIGGGTSVLGTAAGVFGFGGALPGDSWSVLASFKHVWTPQLWSAVTAGYASWDAPSDPAWDGSIDAWRAVFSTAYTPVNNLTFMLDAVYSDVNFKNVAAPTFIDGPVDEDGHAWAVNLWLKRSW